MSARPRSPTAFAPGPHRLALVDAERNRRLEFIVTGGELTSVFGRIDGPQQQTTRSLPDLESALCHAASRLKPVRARGYVESNRNAQLEAEIARSPDDPAGYLVYADWLAAQGEPLGELITVATALDERPKDAVLAAREQELLGADGLSLADPRWRSWPLLYRFGFVEGWRFPHDLERAMKVGDAGDIDTLRRLLGYGWWTLREQLAAIRRHRCGIFVRRVYTSKRSYSIRCENGRWVLERLR